MKMRILHTLSLAALMAASGPAMAQQMGSPQQSQQQAAAERQAELGYPQIDQRVMASVQRQLNQVGYQVRADGVPDANTRNALLAYQTRTGLRPTGLADLGTIAALGVDLGVQNVGQPMVATAQGGFESQARRREFQQSQAMIGQEQQQQRMAQQQPRERVFTGRQTASMLPGERLVDRDIEAGDLTNETLAQLVNPSYIGDEVIILAPSVD